MNSGKTSPSVKVRAPNFASRAGLSPRALPHVGRRRALSLVPLAALGTIVAACSQGNASVDTPIVLGMTSTAPAYYSDDEITLYEAQKQVPLPIRKPTSAEESALGKDPPFPHAPFLLASDVSVEIHYTISNIDKTDHTVELLIDPWNEFGRWAPGVTVVDDDDTEPNFSGIDEYLLVPALSRLEGTITTDDTQNLAANMATVENVLLDPPTNLSVDVGTFCNHVFNVQHRSNDGDPLVTPYIPKIIPGLTGFDLGIRTEEQANVAIEIVMDITDNNGDRVLPDGSTEAPIGRPSTVFSPPGALQGN